MANCGEPETRRDLRVFEDKYELTTDLAEYISQLSESSVNDRGCFTVALSGRSLIRLLEKLSEAPYKKTVDWTKWYVFWADERAVAKNHVDSNYKLTKDVFLSKVSILSNHIFSINDNATVEDAAREYEFTIRQLVKVRTIGVSESNDCPKFDLILLGLGPDGHVASLFPHHPTLELREEWVTYITDSPEPPPERITFALPVINSASNVAIVAIGEENAMAVQLSILTDDGKFDACSLPARLIRPDNGKLVWFLDALAASALNDNNGEPDKL
ncbi:probable 6-phosphogluconolactonase 2 [Zingiber officinale]|uniref:Probable 6-phosphogluconolactonase n=1 Tax=Zingiber officinale TaxID=94328 RepID=A0A8J5EV76_ZINOF|nr:probable 6-phosphogluconolactonase 2 [Zingiber officinale]KAG6472249.1 hypothetical protein ZIOFF_069709 [Zingiber officinale]